MCQGYLPRLRVRTTATQSRVRDGVVRISKRSGHQQRLVVSHQPGDRMDLGSFQRLSQGHGRQNTREAFGEHGLTRPRTSYEEDIM